MTSSSSITQMSGPFTDAECVTAIWERGTDDVAILCKPYRLNLRLIRHASLRVQFAGHTLLVDPQLDRAGAREGVPNTPNPRRSPLVELPMPPAEVVDGVDALLVTHLHTGEIGQQMAPVCGFVLAAPDEPTLYIAGDTILCDEVREALERHRPDVVVVNAGAAQFLEGGPITMDVGDVVAVARLAPEAQIVAVHFESVSHCVETRADLHQRLHDEGLADRVTVPEDGSLVAL
jgi:L-ascorbate metabolism protein UlaG (beta-lactamase superfamily)